MLIEPITTGTAKSDVVSALKQIERIEKEAEQVILHEEKMPFYAFTATSRASLAYWYDNLTDWSALRNDVPNGRFIFIDWFRVMIATVSDAAGAAAGAAIRAAIRVEDRAVFRCCSNIQSTIGDWTSYEIRYRLCALVTKQIFSYAYLQAAHFHCNTDK